jgi:nucleotide-binding universal stress UspA family protein
MFKHLLLPTDGSELSEAATRKGIELAQSMKARVTGFHVMPEFHVLAYQAEMIEATREEFVKNCQAAAKRILAVVENAAKAAGVTCETASTTSDHPYDAIIRAAQARGCDLILMASHGRKGMQGFLLGSETQKVLTHSKIPVLVYR